MDRRKSTDSQITVRGRIFKKLNCREYDPFAENGRSNLRSLKVHFKTDLKTEKWIYIKPRLGVLHPMTRSIIMVFFAVAQEHSKFAICPAVTMAIPFPLPTNTNHPRPLADSQSHEGLVIYRTIILFRKVTCPIQIPMSAIEGIRDLTERLRRMEALADQTTVHRKEFEFALSQLREFF
jgi:hypothetical protein